MIDCLEHQSIIELFFVVLHFESNGMWIHLSLTWKFSSVVWKSLVALDVPTDVSCCERKWILYCELVVCLYFKVPSTHQLTCTFCHDGFLVVSPLSIVWSSTALAKPVSRAITQHCCRHRSVCWHEMAFDLTWPYILTCFRIFWILSWFSMCPPTSRVVKESGFCIAELSRGPLL